LIHLYKQQQQLNCQRRPSSSTTTNEQLTNNGSVSFNEKNETFAKINDQQQAEAAAISADRKVKDEERVAKMNDQEKAVLKEQQQEQAKTEGQAE
jgi:hypothetical protein